jgi:uncharacterized protein YndB with AHSA1/START domain
MIVEQSTHIEAPPDLVWRATADVERWPAWTPTVTSVKRLSEAPWGLGSVARIKQPGQSEADWVVTRFDPGQCFAWETKRAGLRMVGRHEISAEGGGTRNVLQADAHGFLAVFLWPVLRVALRRALMEENQGLKRYCEQVARVATEPS